MELTKTTVDGAGHGLLCPECKIDLVMSERQGIEIDYCTKCRGVWLDRGELDKIIEQSVVAERPGNATPVPSAGEQQAYRDRDYYDDGHGSKRGGHGGGHGSGHGRGRRNDSFLGRLFD